MGHGLYRRISEGGPKVLHTYEYTAVHSRIVASPGRNQHELFYIAKLKRLGVLLSLARLFN